MNNVEKSKQLTAEQIEVMAAFLEGKEIEVQEKSGNSANEIWLPEPAPTWDWHNFDYRVKSETPKKRIVPYDNAEEFIAAQKEHGMYVRERDGLIYMPTTIGNTCVVVGGGSGYSYNILSTEFHFLDGTPCGKEIKMKKIMFNDEYCLTQAVLEGIKTQTRRVIPCSVIAKAEDRRLTYYDRTFDVVSLEQMLLDDGHLSDGKPLFSYRIGEKIAIAQSYRDIQRECMYKDLPNRCFFGGPNSNTSKAGWTNKMFVKPELMLHHIVITGIRVEKLHDISDSDCMAEGIQKGEFMNTRKEYYFSRGENHIPFYTPREAYSSLIDRVSGKGSWDSNPYVFVYDFKLID